MSTTITTGKVRFSYLNVFTPRSMNDGDTAKYSVSLIIPKDDTATIEKIQAAIKKAYQNGKSVFGGKLPKSWKNPLRDGDTDRDDDDPAYEGCYFVNASTTRKPGIVDKDMNAILNVEELYSGCYGRVNVNFYAFNVSGNKGVACGLNHLQKLADGEALGGSRVSVEDAFAEEWADDDDSLLG